MTPGSAEHIYKDKQLCERCEERVATREWHEHSDAKRQQVCDVCWHILEAILMDRLNRGIDSGLA